MQVDYKKIKVVCFDLDDTILNHQNAVEKSLENIFQNNIIFHDKGFDYFKDLWISLSSKYYNLYLSKKYTFEEQRFKRVYELYQNFGKEIRSTEVKIFFEIYLFFYRNNWSLFSDVLPSLEYLCKKGKKIGIISNGDSTQQKDKMVKTNIVKYFFYCFFSSEIGFSKPSTEIFDYVINFIGIKKNELLMIGDNYDTDIEPCLKQKIPCFWLVRNQESRDCTNINLPIISSLKEIEYVL